MRPERGVLQCIRCARDGRARTVMAKGKTVRLGAGQASLGSMGAPSKREGPLEPQKPAWKPKTSGGKPHDSLGLFPYETIRGGQRSFARDVTMAVAGGKHLVAHAPTGIGKTAASLAPALAHALEAGRTVLFLTSRQSQHRIAVETLRAIREQRGAQFTLVDLVAKRDMCLRHEAADMLPSSFPDFCARETRTKSCKFIQRDVDNDTLQRVADGVLHVEELMGVSKDAGLCPHLVAMTAAQHAQVVVADYNHLFSDIRARTLERLGAELRNLVVIVDEAHNLPDRIRQSHAHKINIRLLDQVEEEARRHGAKFVEADLPAMRDILFSLSAEAERSGKAEKQRFGEERSIVRLEIDDLHAAFEHRRRGFGTQRTLADAQEDLAELVQKLRREVPDGPVASDRLLAALEDWGRFRDGALRFLQWDDRDDVELHIKLLDPGMASGPVFRDVHSAILMSGTLEPPEAFRDVLGLHESRTKVKHYRSPFPAANKFVTIGKGYTTAFRRRDATMWYRYAEAVARVCQATRGNVALFAPSYAILRDIMDVVAVDKEIVEEESGMGKAERDRVLDTLAGAKKRGGALLCGVLGGSFAEGVDFKNGLLSAVIIAGVPYAPRDLEVEATIAHYNKDGKNGEFLSYQVPAAAKVRQAMGRGIRGPDDKCAIILLDERWQQPTLRNLLGGEPVATPEPAEAAAAFVQANGL